MRPEGPVEITGLWRIEAVRRIATLQVRFVQLENGFLYG